MHCLSRLSAHPLLVMPGLAVMPAWHMVIDWKAKGSVAAGTKAH